MPKKPRKLTPAQTSLADDLQQIYGIQPEQIFFEGDGLDNVYLDHAATVTIANELGDFTDITLRRDEETKLKPAEVGAVCSITTARGFSRSNFGVARVGAEMPFGVIENEEEALDVAKARALRATLILVNFDPIKAHLAAMQGDSPLAGPRTLDDQRKAELAQIHVLADELGFGKAQHREKYHDMVHLFTGYHSAGDLNSLQRAELIRDWQQLKGKSPGERAAYITGLRDNRWRWQEQRAALPKAA